MNRIVLAVVGFTIVALSTLQVSAGNRGPRLTGVYSDMRYVAEAGDVIGNEVIIVYTTKGYYGIIQIAEGEPSVPAVVPITVDGWKISFKLPGDQGGGLFHGRVNEVGLTGRFEDGLEPWNLKRGRSYWQ